MKKIIFLFLFSFFAVISAALAEDPIDIQREHEARESELRTYEAAARKRWDEQEEACTAASKALEAVKFRAQRRLDDTAGARARLEKLERRIAIHRAAHPELEGEVKS